MTNFEPSLQEQPLLATYCKLCHSRMRYTLALFNFLLLHRYGKLVSVSNLPDTFAHRITTPYLVQNCTFYDTLAAAEAQRKYGYLPLKSGTRWRRFFAILLLPCDWHQKILAWVWVLVLLNSSLVFLLTTYVTSLNASRIWCSKISSNFLRSLTSNSQSPWRKMWLKVLQMLVQTYISQRQEFTIWPLNNHERFQPDAPSWNMQQLASRQTSCFELCPTSYGSNLDSLGPESCSWPSGSLQIIWKSQDCWRLGQHFYFPHIV